MFLPHDFIRRPSNRKLVQRAVKVRGDRNRSALTIVDLKLPTNAVAALYGGRPMKSVPNPILLKDPRQFVRFPNTNICTVSPHNPMPDLFQRIVNAESPMSFGAAQPLDMGQSWQTVVSSGFASMDAELPGGGHSAESRRPPDCAVLRL